MNNIYLVGFMGTGKSSVGALLAKAKKWHFVDIDELISLRQQRRIVDIFAKEGEAYFRRLEKKTLKEITIQKHFVVSCGGGIVIDKDNVKLMKKTGLLICLGASAGEICKRVSGDNSRPLLMGKDPLKRIELLLKMRAPYYMQANHCIDTTGLSIKQVVARISRLLRKK